jgi:hypothetical protein
MLYFSRAEQVRYGAQLAAIGATRDLVWIANELPVVLEAGGFSAPTTVQDGGLPLVLRYVHNGGVDDTVLAHVGPHGRWLHWY